MIISGDRVTVLGEVSGTPVAPLFGQPATGKPFDDAGPSEDHAGRQTGHDLPHGKLAPAAMTQLRAKVGPTDFAFARGGAADTSTETIADANRGVDAADLRRPRDFG